MKFEVFMVLVASVLAIHAANQDGSRCPNVSCSPPLPGASCRASYEREDGCCPVWYCTLNGATSTIYGKIATGGGGGSSFSSWSSSTGGGGGGGFFQSSSSGGGFPQIKLPNILGQLFGRR